MWPSASVAPPGAVSWMSVRGLRLLASQLRKRRPDAKKKPKKAPLRGSSPRPYAYEAHALPTELRRRPRDLSQCLSGNMQQSALRSLSGFGPDARARKSCSQHARPWHQPACSFALCAHLRSSRVWGEPPPGMPRPTGTEPNAGPASCQQWLQSRPARITDFCVGGLGCDVGNHSHSLCAPACTTSSASRAPSSRRSPRWRI